MIVAEVQALQPTEGSQGGGQGCSAQVIVAEVQALQPSEGLQGAGQG